MKFWKHVDKGAPLDTTLAQIARSPLSDRTKRMIPSATTLQCTIKNINWLLRYWTEHDFPDPIQPQFGYARSGPRGVVGYEA